MVCFPYGRQFRESSTNRPTCYILYAFVYAYCIHMCVYFVFICRKHKNKRHEVFFSFFTLNIIFEFFALYSYIFGRSCFVFFCILFFSCFIALFHTFINLHCFRYFFPPTFYVKRAQSSTPNRYIYIYMCNVYYIYTQQTTWVVLFLLHSLSVCLWLWLLCRRRVFLSPFLLPFLLFGFASLDSHTRNQLQGSTYNQLEISI